MLGYLGRQDATAETIDSDGFLHTGDIATVGAQGEFYIVDRLKELIKYKGYQVAPAELEALLLTHPDITDAAVVGAQDDDGQEIPKAFVVRRDGSDLDEQGRHGSRRRTRRSAQEGACRGVHRGGAEKRLGEDPAQGPQGDVSQVGLDTPPPADSSEAGSLK